MNNAELRRFHAAPEGSLPTSMPSTALHLTAVASSAGSGIIADAAVYYSDPHAPGAVQRLEAIGHDIARLIAAHRAAVAAIAPTKAA
jgi:hypothetical protein